MLERLRHEAATKLAQITACTLATTGPAGIYASWERCTSHGLRLYLLIAAATDHVLNIETTGEVALAGDSWHLVGKGICLVETSGPWLLTRQPWQVVVEVIPARLYLAGEHGQLMQSIDFVPLHP